MSDRDLADFWRWSGEHYRRDGVEALVLRLQDDFDFNVNILLWMCWCAAQYEALPDLVIRNAIELTADWNRNVTANLRSARRHVKSPRRMTIPAEQLYVDIKRTELEAEKAEQLALQAYAEKTLKLAPQTQTNEIAVRARRNLAAYAMLLRAGQKKGFSTSLLQSLISHIYAAGAPSAANEV